MGKDLPVFAILGGLAGEFTKAFSYDKPLVNRYPYLAILSLSHFQEMVNLYRGISTPKPEQHHSSSSLLLSSLQLSDTTIYEP